MSDERDKALGIFGWDPFFEKAWREIAQPGWLPARVTGEERGHFRVQLSESSSVWAEVTGKLRREATEWTWPTTGDWVAITPRSGEDRVTLHATLPRKTCLYRKEAKEDGAMQILAANVDTAFVVTSLNKDFNPRRVERYLALILDGGAQPVVLLTKADLVGDPGPSIRQIESIAPEVPVFAISVREHKGLEPLHAFLQPGQTVVLLGSSGVGKSTLANHLLGKALLRTQEVREFDDRGRHTTTSRQLFLLPAGGMLIDTPGMRELQLGDHEVGVQTLFEEIAELAAWCRFRDCRHTAEPGCAVRAALDGGTLSAERFASYQKLQGESRFQESKTDKAALSEEKKRHRVMATALRKRLKDKDRK